MDVDTDLQYVGNGNQTYSKNTRAVTNFGQTGWAKEIVVGNIAAFQIGHTLNAQNKKIRFYVNNTSGAVWAADLYDQNHVLIGSSTYTVPPATAIGVVLAAVAADIVAAAAGGTPSWAANSFTDTLPGSTTEGYVEIDLFQTQSGSNWFATFTGETEVTQEAWSKDILGRYHAIASADYLGNLFIFSTPSTNLPMTVDVADVSLVAGSITITTVTPHGMVTGDLARLSGTTATTFEGNPVDGVWIITRVDDTTYTLDDQNFGVGSTGLGTSTAWYRGIGEIGVATYNENTNVWTYERLLRATQLNFRTKHQHPTPQVVYSNDTYSIYYTDDYNYPGVFYYHGPYFTDGAIGVLNPGYGTYDYDSVGNETRLQQNRNNTTLVYNDQYNTGGTLQSGSYRYTTRQLTAELVATPYLTLSQTVPVYVASTDQPGYNILGSFPGDPTTKINSLTVSGLDMEVYKYVELVAVYYSTQFSVQAWTVSRSLITSDTMDLEHTGSEPGLAFLDTNELLAQEAVVLTAKTNLMIDDRYLLGNLTTPTQYDLTDWSTQFEHALNKQAIPSITVNGDPDNPVLGEYQDPANVFAYMGYMGYEQYRFWVKVTYKNGLVSDPFYVDDIDFTTSATNVVTTANTPYGNRRVSGLTDYSLTDNAGGGDTPYAFYVTFSNINLNYLLPDGNLLRDVIDKFEIGRNECIPEVLVTGITLPSDDTAGTYHPQTDWWLTCVPPAPGIYAHAAGNTHRHIGFMYSPDIAYGQASYAYQAGDTLLNFCVPVEYYNENAVSVYNFFVDNNGSLVAPFDVAAQVLDIEAAQSVVPWSGGAIIANSVLGPVTWNMAHAVGAAVYSHYSNLALSFTQTMGAPAALDTGLYITSIYRQDTDKYASISTGSWIPTGHSYTVTEASPTLLGGQDVFGGDTFTQKSYLREAMGSTVGPPTAYHGDAFGVYTQNRANIQLRYNTSAPGYVYPDQFDTYYRAGWLSNPDRDKMLYSNTYTPNNMISDTLAYDAALTRVYDFPYRIIYSGTSPQGSVSDGFRKFQAFDFYDIESDYGELIHMLKVNGGLFTWQPRAVFLQYFRGEGNLQLSDIAQEVIVGAAGAFPRAGRKITGNGSKHMFGIQKGVSGNGQEFVIWVDTAMKKLMKYDASSGARGISDIDGFRSYMAANLEWVDDWDTPADGLGISMCWDVRFSDMYITVMAPRQGEVWTIGTNYSVGDIVYLSTQPDGTYTSFEKMTELYVAIAASSPSTADDEPEAGVNWETNWEKVSHDNNEYFNQYTIAYNEVKNKVTEFYSFKPKIYFNCDDVVLSSFPCLLTEGDGWGENNIYEHNKGRYAGWYESVAFNSAQTLNFTIGSTTVTAASGMIAQFPHPEAFTYILQEGSNEYIIASVTNDTDLEIETAAVATGTGGIYTVLQAEDAQVEMVMNAYPNISKNMRALQFATEILPHRVELETKTHESYLEESDFRYREGYWYSTIKKDSTNSGINTSNTSRLWGRWLKVNLFMERLVYQKLYNFIVSIIDNNRHP